MGMKALVFSLQTTEYKFRSNKGPKILNALMACLKLAAKYNQINFQNEDMDFETFADKFKKLYLEERRRQELEGVVAIHSKEICQKFRQNHHISELLLEKYFEQLKDELDSLEKFPQEIEETRVIFRELIKQAAQKFRRSIPLLIYLVGTSDNVSSLIEGDSVLKSLVKKSTINLSLGSDKEFMMIKQEIEERIKGAYKGYKNFNNAWE
ncbi:hypothetical protein ACP6PM_16680 [Dapis sp. BLCC M229]